MSKINSSMSIPRAIENFNNIRSTAYKTMQNDSTRGKTVSAFVRQDIYDLLAVADFCVSNKQGKGLKKRVDNLRKDIDRYQYRENGIMMVKLEFDQFIDFLNDVLSAWSTAKRIWEQEEDEKKRKRDEIKEYNRQDKLKFEYDMNAENQMQLILLEDDDDEDVDTEYDANEYARELGYDDLDDFIYKHGYKSREQFMHRPWHFTKYLKYTD